MDTLQLPIQFTPNALSELKKIWRQESNETAPKYLRVGVKGGGCTGLSYILLWETHPSETDQIHTLENIPLLINPAHVLYIKNMVVDFERGLNARGFVFNNPNAQETCGCGSSFSI